MFIKLYEKLIKVIKENYLWLLLYIVFITTCLYPLPYYIYTGGGIIDISGKVEIEDSTDSLGSFNMCYVSEINATLPTYIMSYFINSWDKVAKEEVTLAENETREDVLIRDKISLLKANQNAIITAYSYANINYDLTDLHNYIIYIDPNSDTNLKIGDELISIDNIDITNISDITQILEDKNIGDRLNIIVEENNKKVNKYAIVRQEDNRKIIGISFETIYDYNTLNETKFNFSSNESGPSGGLMLSLYIYDKLVEEDITKGLKISGTGTISENGEVGEIGGVKYKLKGAVKAKSDLFIVPNGDNYDEAIKEKEKNNYSITIIGVSTFEEALKKIEEM